MSGFGVQLNSLVIGVTFHKMLSFLKMLELRGFVMFGLFLPGFSNAKKQ